MKNELQALQVNKTWTLAPKPAGTKVVGLKWVFRTKLKEDGSVDRYKAWFMTQGYTSIPSLDFVKTFSLIIKSSNIWVLFVIIVTLKWYM